MAVQPAERTSATGRVADRASFTDEWFAEAPQGGLGPPRRASRAGAIVSVALITAVVAATLLLWDRGLLPRWTGSAPPPEPVGRTEITSGAASSEDHVVDLANGAATEPSPDPVTPEPEPTAIAVKVAVRPAPAGKLAPSQTATPSQTAARGMAPAPTPTEAPAPMPTEAPAPTESPAPTPTESPAPATVEPSPGY